MAHRDTNYSPAENAVLLRMTIFEGGGGEGVQSDAAGNEPNLFCVLVTLESVGVGLAGSYDVGKC